MIECHEIKEFLENKPNDLYLSRLLGLMIGKEIQNSIKKEVTGERVLRLFSNPSYISHKGLR
jgi:hypothetical protein